MNRFILIIVTTLFLFSCGNKKNNNEINISKEDSIKKSLEDEFLKNNIAYGKIKFGITKDEFLKNSDIDTIGGIRCKISPFFDNVGELDKLEISRDNYYHYQISGSPYNLEATIGNHSVGDNTHTQYENESGIEFEWKTFVSKIKEKYGEADAEEDVNQIFPEFKAVQSKKGNLLNTHIWNIKNKEISVGIGLYCGVVITIKDNKISEAYRKYIAKEDSIYEIKLEEEKRNTKQETNDF
jgi:hypothetical protein